MKTLVRIVCAIAGIAVPATAANAALIVRDYATAGDGLLTYDTSTGLEWLDFSVSYGRAPGAALSTYTDFHMASADEAKSLFVGAGMPADHVKFEQYAYYLDDLDAGHLLSATVGVTGSYFNGIVEVINARVLRPDGGHWDLYSSEIRTPPAGTPGMMATFLRFGNSLGGWQNNHADFLVRVGAPEVGGVPEPATWALMIAGFGAVGGALRSRRRAASIRFA